MKHTVGLLLVLIGTNALYHTGHAQYRMGCIEQSKSLTGADQALSRSADIAVSLSDEEGAKPDAYRCYVKFLAPQGREPICAPPRTSSNIPVTRRQFSYPAAQAGRTCYFDQTYEDFFNTLKANHGAQQRIQNVPGTTIFEGVTDLKNYLEKGIPPQR